jgi:hypothetical protein
LRDVEQHVVEGEHPADGESVTLIVVATAVYLAGITGFEVVSRRGQRAG